MLPSPDLNILEDFLLPDADTLEELEVFNLEEDVFKILKEEN